MTGSFGVLDDLARGSASLRSSPAASLPGVTDEVAATLEDVARHLFTSKSDALASDARVLATRTRGAGDELRWARGEQPVRLVRPFGARPSESDAASGVRSLATEIDGFVGRARGQVPASTGTPAPPRTTLLDDILDVIAFW